MLVNGHRIVPVVEDPEIFGRARMQANTPLIALGVGGGALLFFIILSAFSEAVAFFLGSLLIGHNIIFGWLLVLRGPLRDFAGALHDRLCLRRRHHLAALFPAAAYLEGAHDGGLNSWLAPCAGSASLLAAPWTQQGATLSLHAAPAGNGVKIDLTRSWVKRVTAARAPLLLQAALAAPVLALSAAAHVGLLSRKCYVRAPRPKPPRAKPQPDPSTQK